jgi:hypothetical protein
MDLGCQVSSILRFHQVLQASIPSQKRWLFLFSELVEQLELIQLRYVDWKNSAQMDF